MLLQDSLSLASRQPHRAFAPKSRSRNPNLYYILSDKIKFGASVTKCRVVELVLVTGEDCMRHRRVKTDVINASNFLYFGPSH